MVRTLSETEADRIVQNPENRDSVAIGRVYESELKVYTEPLSKNELLGESGYNSFLLDIRNHLDNVPKYERTKEFIRYPFPIVTTTNDIARDLYKVFDARNASFYNTCKNKSQEERLDELLHTVKIKGFIERVGKRVLLNKPNTFVVIDKDDKGTPYLVPVFNDSLLGFGLDKDGETLTYICFLDSTYKDEQGNKVEKIALYDSGAYRVYEKVNSEYTLIVNNPHDLGYCPARSFFDVSVNSVSKCNKWSPFADSLAKIKTYMRYDTYIEYAELIGVFPITEMPKVSCDNEDCIDGYIETPLADGETKKHKCSTCNSPKIIGAGTVIEVDPAQYKEEMDDRGIFRYIVPPIENLKFEKDEQVNRVNDIKKDITGKNSVLEKEAVNIEQITALVEDSKKPLMFISSMLNRLHEWIVETVGRLENIEVKAFANYGTEWYLFDQEATLTLFETAKKAGVSESELSDLYELMIDTKYKHNPYKAQKIKIESNLDPSPFSTLEECYKKYDNGVMTKQDLAIKANFTKYIKRFEREVSDLVEFGSDAIKQNTLTFANKIDKIYNELIKYYKEDEQTRKNDTEQIRDERGSELD